jgi:hypothetical protein
MPDPAAKGIYFVNGQSSVSLTAYHVQSKQSTDIASDNATNPTISPDGKRVMYCTLLRGKRHELWVSDIDGANKLKLATGENLSTGWWAPDNFHLTFVDFEGAGTGSKAYIVAADGSGLREVSQTENVLRWTAWGQWSPDQKTLYLSVSEKVGSIPTVWKWNMDGSKPEKFAGECGEIYDIDPSGQYLLVSVFEGEKIGIGEVSISERKCIPLIPGVATTDVYFARDGKSFLYAIASRGEVTIYRQLWKDGKTIGVPQVASKLPFSFPEFYAGTAYDLSRDLSTIVYSRPSGHADLYFLSQK